MNAARPRRNRMSGWEGRLLAALTYPANIALGAVAALIIALPVVTLVPAMIALARALTWWARDKNDAVFTNTFREFAATWRQTLGWGFAATFVFVVIAGDLIFLAMQLSVGQNPVALMFSVAMLPFAALFLVYLLAVSAASAQAEDRSSTDWMRLGVALVFGQPKRTAAVAVVGALVLTTCVLLPTLAPFIFISVPLYAAVRIWRPHDTPSE